MCECVRVCVNVVALVHAAHTEIEDFLSRACQTVLHRLSALDNTSIFVERNPLT